MGRVAQELRVNPPTTPQEVSVESLAHLVTDKRVVFYTGAGISAGVVPTMNELVADLGLNISWKEANERKKLIQHVILHATELIAVLNGFFKACLHGEPTGAHHALRDVVLFKEWGLLTENLDLLHQRSGIEPLHHGSSQNWLTDAILPEHLRKIDFVITVGLPCDESGFLAWYKEHNPHGTIVAINRERPPYLGNDDYLVRGDIQHLVPQLKKIILLKAPYAT